MLLEFGLGVLLEFSGSAPPPCPMRHAIFLFQRRVGLILDVSYLFRTNPAVGLHITKAKSSLFGVSVGRNRIAIRQEPGARSGQDSIGTVAADWEARIPSSVFGLF